MKFQSKTENQLAEANLIPEGTYPFEVIKAIDGKSKSSGADMITLKLKIFQDADSGILLEDYLLESVGYKLFHFCAYNGLTKQYENGTLVAADCEGKTGYVKVGHQAGKDKGDGSGDCWPTKNTVKDYVRQEGLKKTDVLAPAPDKKPAAPDTDVPY